MEEKKIKSYYPTVSSDTYGQFLVNFLGEFFLQGKMLYSEVDPSVVFPCVIQT